MKKIIGRNVLGIMLIWSMTAVAQSPNTVVKDNIAYKADYSGRASVVSSPKARGEVTILDKITIDKRELKVTYIYPTKRSKEMRISQGLHCQVLLRLLATMPF